MLPEAHPRGPAANGTVLLARPSLSSSFLEKTEWSFIKERSLVTGRGGLFLGGGGRYYDWVLGGVWTIF